MTKETYLYLSGQSRWGWRDWSQIPRACILSVSTALPCLCPIGEWSSTHGSSVTMVAIAYSRLGLKTDFIHGCDEYRVTPGKISEVLWLLSFLLLPQEGDIRFTLCYMYCLRTLKHTWRESFPARRLGSWYLIEKNKCWEVRDWFLSIDLFQASAAKEAEIESYWPVIICQENTSLSKPLIVSSEPVQLEAVLEPTGQLLTTL